MTRYAKSCEKLLSILFAFTIFQIQTSFGQGPTGCDPNANGIVKRSEIVIPPKNLTAITGGRISCIQNVAAGYGCFNVHLESFIPTQDLNGGISVDANDLWGWTSSVTGIEYAIIGLRSGTSFVSLADPINPVVLGKLRSQTYTNFWRDMKTFNDYAFIVSEATSHGLQIFDLRQIESVSTFTKFEVSAHFDGFGSAHNIAINEDTGYAYILGANLCRGGLYMVDINDALNPIFVGCYSERDYTHDAQCVIYDGPDERFHNKEICFASSVNQVDIIDVTEKSNPVRISSCSYLDHRYIHQGWLTEDKTHFIIDDERDEKFGIDQQLGRARTETFLCDVSNLKRPFMRQSYRSPLKAIDHNQYIKGNHTYQANYRAGLRILDVSNIQCGGNFLTEVGYFDVWPDDDDTEYNGAWGTYPFFDSGIVIVSAIEHGLFVLRPGNFTEATEMNLFQKLLWNVLFFDKRHVK